jgi:prepilin-type N-terminal cleavage/methylation domain-containing protein
MMKRERGFSLIELLMVIIIFGIVLAGVSDLFVGMLRGYRQQSKIAESNIEGIIGLELLRRDINSAGYGLPWMFSTAVTYQATNATAQHNDKPSNPPRPILNGDSAGRIWPDQII